MDRGPGGRGRQAHQPAQRLKQRQLHRLEFQGIHSFIHTFTLHACTRPRPCSGSHPGVVLPFTHSLHVIIELFVSKRPWNGETRETQCWFL